MNLWNPYVSESSKSTFGSERMQLKTGQRWHTSLAMVEQASSELSPNSVLHARYSDSSRYVIAKNITFDVFVSLYDVDRRIALFLRPTSLVSESEIRKTAGMVRKERMGNIEVRLIGLQNWRTEIARNLIEFSKISDSKLAEADIFGNNVRNIVLDLKTGESYDLLLQNRIYAPTELINNTQLDEFNSNASKLSFP